VAECTENLGTLESTSEIPGMFCNVVLEKDDDQLDQSCQKWSITKSLGGQEYSTYNKKEGRLTGLVTASAGNAI
jgi:hypothetical protein